VCTLHFHSFSLRVQYERIQTETEQRRDIDYFDMRMEYKTRKDGESGRNSSSGWIVHVTFRVYVCGGDGNFGVKAWNEWIKQGISSTTPNSRSTLLHFTENSVRLLSLRIAHTTKPTTTPLKTQTEFGKVWFIWLVEIEWNEINRMLLSCWWWDTRNSNAQIASYLVLFLQ
jgi:hypothetical protein